LQEAFGYFGQYEPNDGVKDIEAAIHAIRRGELGAPAVQKVGCVGYCLGGRLAYMAAARTDVDASVGYYGVMIDTMLNESHAIANPLMLHIPTADHFVGPRSAGRPRNPSQSPDYQGLDHEKWAIAANLAQSRLARLCRARSWLCERREWAIANSAAQMISKPCSNGSRKLASIHEHAISG
jgi:carboxymethylenebutenolidase